MKRSFVNLGLILLLLTLAVSCSKEKPDDPDPRPLPHEQLIVGCWEWVYFAEWDPIQIDTGHLDEDELFWVFTDDGEYCDHEFDRWDSCYHVSCQGSYVITATTVTIECSSGTKIVAVYEFSDCGDTLFCTRGLDFIVMKRDEAHPDFGGIGSAPRQQKYATPEPAGGAR